MQTTGTGRTDEPLAGRGSFSAAEIGAIAHLYRGELYRSTVWRTRLDSTTNWAVVTTGIALTATFTSAEASPLPLLLAGLLAAVFAATEARRYRFYDFWRIRAHVLELYFYGPMLQGRGVDLSSQWNEIMAADYRAPNLHISLFEALGRRIRRNYAWIFAVQAASFCGKLLVHPVPAQDLSHFIDRAAIGPVPGLAILALGAVFHASWCALALFTLRSRRGIHAKSSSPSANDAMLKLAQGQPVITRLET